MAGFSDNRAARHGSRWRRLGWGAAAIALCIPWIAMQFTNEVSWTLNDFAVFGAMLLAAGIVLEVAARISFDRTYRFGAGLAIAGAFFLVWANGAVGLIGNESNPANLLYAGVLGVIVVGALLCRLRAGGMSVALFIAALAQLAVPLVAWQARIGPVEAVMRPGVWVVTAMFVAIWIAAGLLFRGAARDTF